MIFRQLFDSTSSTYTYLLASRHGAEALIIDPVLERVDRYIQLLKELDLRLVKAIDTHLLPAILECHPFTGQSITVSFRIQRNTNRLNNSNDCRPATFQVSRTF